MTVQFAKGVVLAILHKNMSLLSFPEISVNSSSVTRGNKYKLLNQTFTTTYGIYTEDPRLICGTRLVSGALLMSVQVNQTPGLYALCGARHLPGARLLTEVLR